MQVKSIALIGAAVMSLILTGCAHESTGRADHMRIMKADGIYCSMRGDVSQESRDRGTTRDQRDHERESAARSDRGPNKEMSGCQMMGEGKGKPHRESRAPEARDPHAGHRPK